MVAGFDLLAHEGMNRANGTIPEGDPGWFLGWGIQSIKHDKAGIK